MLFSRRSLQQAEQTGGKYSALTELLRSRIASGEIPHGSKLPSTRSLAASLGYSRGTVVLAYDILWSEGVLEKRRGSGFSVTGGQQPTAPPVKRRKSPRLPLSDWARRLTDAPPTRYPVSRRGEIHFFQGFPDESLFAHREWRQCLSYAVRKSSGFRADSLAPAEGLLDLRTSIAELLYRQRGLRTTADNIVVFNGSAQAFNILVQLFVRPRTPVVLENPGYHNLLTAVQAHGGRVIPAAVDDDGLIVENWRSRLLFVTAGRHYPTGATLSAQRRIELLDWAERRDALIVENDFDNEFRRRGRLLEPLKVLDTGNRVIFVSTFSKTVHGGLRIGYAVIPDGIVRLVKAARRASEPLATALIEQAALARYLQHGFYERHLRRMRRVYLERHDALVDAFSASIPGAFRWAKSDAGLHIFGWWTESEERFKRFQRRCAEAGILFESANRNFLGTAPSAAIFGFSHLEPERLCSAVKQMGRIYAAL